MSSATALATYQGAIGTTLQDTGAFKTVRALGGRFSKQDLERFAVSAPAATVAVEEANLLMLGNWPWADVGVGIVLAAKGSEGIHRYQEILGLAGTVLELLATGPGPCWGIDGVGFSRVRKVESENMYAPPLDRMGVALWLVTFMQQVELKTLADLEPKDSFLQLYVEYDIKTLASTPNTDQLLFFQGDVPLVPDNAVIVEELADFPAPVGGVIHLNNHVWYHIVGEVNISPNVIEPAVGSVITGVHAAHSKIVTNSINPLIIVDDVKEYLRLQFVGFVQQGTGKCLSCEGIGQINTFLYMDNVQFDAAGGGDLGTLKAGFFIAKNTVFKGFTNGWTFNDATNFAVQEEVLYQQTGGAGIIFDLSNTTFTTFRLRQSSLQGHSSGTPTVLAGLTESANIAPGGLGELIAVRYVDSGGVAQLTGVVPQDLRWNFERCQGFVNTVTIGSSKLTNNTTLTTFSAPNTLTVPVGTPTFLGGKRFDQGSPAVNHKVRLIAERFAPIKVNASGAIGRDSGTESYRVVLRRNGVVVDQTTRELSAATRNANFLLQHIDFSPSQNDEYQVMWECTTGTNSAIMEQCDITANMME